MNIDISTKSKNGQVTTALLLAAGAGSRLSPHTDQIPKCLVKVNGKSILERLVDTLGSYGFRRLVVVVGYRDKCIRDFLGTRIGQMEITYILNPIYNETNNIYSLWLARKMIDEPFLLVESDLVFEPSMLKDMLLPDRIAIASQRPWMNGTTVSISPDQKISAFWLSDSDTDFFNVDRYKTVNIYSLSMASWRSITEKLEHRISSHKVGEYYETIFSELVSEGSLSLAPVLFGRNQWYEIDTPRDLHEAEKLFPQCAGIDIPMEIVARSTSKPSSLISL